VSSQNGKAIGILGGGPAGLSAALWLSNFGFAPWVADAEGRAGGMQNLNFLANDWVLGQVGLTGPQLASRFADQVRSLGVPILTARGPQRIERIGTGFRVALARAGDASLVLDCTALLVATGTRFRGPEVLGTLAGRDSVPAECWAYGPYAFADMERCRGQRLLIVGGGDNAFENARLLRGSARSIDMALRSPPRAQQALREAVSDAVRIHQPAVLDDVRMVGNAIRAMLSTDAGVQELMVDRIHVLAGYEPNTFFLRTAFMPPAGFHCDDAGYLVTDNAGRTNVDGVYAAGDVCNPAFPSVVAALAQGARAAKTIELDLRSL